MIRRRPPCHRAGEIALAVSFVVEGLERRRLLSSSLSGGVLTINADAATDTVSVTETSANVIVTENGTASAYPASSVTSISGTAGRGTVSIKLDKTVTQDATLVGGTGGDTLWGGAGDDSITGGSGNCDIYGGAGNNTLTGGTGVDNTLDYSTETKSLTIDDGTTTRGDGGSDQTSGFDIYVGGSGGDSITLDNEPNVSVYGGSGNDNISVMVPYLDDPNSTASILIDGGAGDDTLSADAAANTSSNINVSLNGGAGNDLIAATSFAGIGPHFNVDGGDGNDTIGYSADDYNVSPETAPGSDFDGGAGNNTINVFDCDEEGPTKFPLIVNLNGESNELFGSDTLSNFNNAIAGSSRESSIVTGNANDDFLEGGNNDTVTGGSGNDTIVGLGAADLYGGSGTTVFVDADMGEGEVDGGTGFAIAQANPNVSFENIASFYDGSSNVATTQAVGAAIQALAVPTVSLSGTFSGVGGTTTYTVSFHYHPTLGKYAGTFTQGSTSVAFYSAGTLTSTSVVAKNQATHKAIFTGSISGEDLIIDIGGKTYKLKKVKSTTTSPVPSPVSPSSLATAGINSDGQLVVSGVSGVSEQINVSESGSELVVTATPSGSSTPVQLTGSPFSTSEIGSMDSISKKLNQSLEDAFQVVVTANGSGTDTLQLSAYSTSADPVSLYGGLYAGTGNDSLVGGSGNVVMVAGTGNDTLLGGTGAQSIADYQNYSQTLSVDLQDGTATKGSGQQDVLKNIDYVFGGSGSDTLKGGTGTSRIEAGTGTDFLEGGAGTGTTYLIASGCDKIGTFDTLQGGAGSTGFFMGGDNYKEYFENYNPTLDTTFSADQGIDFDLDTNSLYGNS